MSRKKQPIPAGSDALRHPVRQALFILVRQRPATAKELERAVGRPRRSIAYHLKVLVKDEYLEADTTRPEEPVYRPHPTVRARLPLGAASLDRVLAFTFLDAAWAALGESPDTVIDPISETLRVDALGLSEASEVIRGALGECRRIAIASKEREDGPPPHLIVVVASLVDEGQQ
jgi:DNA-binding transcriptional ArsR family regulator